MQDAGASSPVPLRLSCAAAASSCCPGRRGATHCSSPAGAQCPTRAPQNPPILPCFPTAQGAICFLSFSFLLCERGAGGGRGGGILSPPNISRDTIHSKLFPFQTVSEVFPVITTPDPRPGGEPLNFKPSFSSPSLSSSSPYLHLHRHLHLRHPPTAAAATSSASFPPPPPFFSLFGSRWTSGVDGGSCGSLSSSPRSTQLSLTPPHSPAPSTTLAKGAGPIGGGGGEAAAAALAAAAGGRMSARGEGAGQPSTSAQGQPAAPAPQKRGRGRPRKQQQVSTVPGRGGSPSPPPLSLRGPREARKSSRRGRRALPAGRGAGCGVPCAAEPRGARAPLDGEVGSLCRQPDGGGKWGQAKLVRGFSLLCTPLSVAVAPDA